MRCWSCSRGRKGAATLRSSLKPAQPHFPPTSGLNRGVAHDLLPFFTSLARFPLPSESRAFPSLLRAAPGNEMRRGFSIDSAKERLEGHHDADVERRQLCLAGVSLDARS
eukprot:3637488-Rhodomonas_salina.1